MLYTDIRLLSKHEINEFDKLLARMNVIYSRCVESNLHLSQMEVEQSLTATFNKKKKSHFHLYKKYLNEQNARKLEWENLEQTEVNSWPKERRKKRKKSLQVREFSQRLGSIKEVQEETPTCWEKCRIL
jgi:hypothetical protein